MANADSTGRRNTTLPAHLLSHWQELFRRGNIRDCENDARKLINDFPQAGKAWQLLGASLLADGRPDEALPALRRASALAPADWSIWDNLALALQRQAISPAPRDLSHRTGPCARRSSLWSNAAVNALESGDPPTALILAWEAIRLAPNLAVAHLNVGNALSASGQSAEAEAAFLQALSIQPDYVQALLSLGREQSQRGQIADAIDTTRRALAIKPDYADAHVNLGHGLNTLGDVALAAEHYLRALALKPRLLLPAAVRSIACCMTTGSRRKTLRQRTGNSASSLKRHARSIGNAMRTALIPSGACGSALSRPTCAIIRSRGFSNRSGAPGPRPARAVRLRRAAARRHRHAPA
jgi:tetratricopeptide (TPR) repeat protein